MRIHEIHPRTMRVNNKQKSLSKKARDEALYWLAATFPNAFDNTLSIHPLKLGIMEDILLHADTAAAMGISKSKLREAVVIYARRIDYLTSLKAKEMRIDLQGNPVNAVTEEEAERAAAKIKKRIEKCAKNARKILLNSPQPKSSSPLSHSHSERLEQPVMSIASKPAIIVKSKAARQYDPEAVARLKEKLGLST
jgi:ProP effector